MEDVDQFHVAQDTEEWWAAGYTNETSGYIKDGYLLDQMRDFQLFKQNSAPRSYPISQGKQHMAFEIQEYLMRKNKSWEADDKESN